MNPTLPSTLQKYVDHMAATNRPMEFTEIVSVTPGINCFRRLHARGLVENVVKGYTGAPGEVYTGPRMPKYVLTTKGRMYVRIPAPTVTWSGTGLESLRAVMHRTGETDPYRADHIRRGGRF